MVLIQHHCVLHSRPSNDTVGNDEYFEIDRSEVLSRMRFGFYLAIAREWGGEEVRHYRRHILTQAQAIVRLLLYHGQMRASDVENLLAHVPEHALNDVKYGVEPQEAFDANQAARIRRLLVQMLQSSLVRPSTPVQHVSRQDRQLAYENMLRNSHKGIPTAKLLREVKVKAAAMIDEEDRREWEGVDDDTGELRLGLKRKSSITEPQREKRHKRQGYTDVSAARAEADGVEIDGEIWLRVHYDFFNAQLRNQILVNAVLRKYNAVTADVCRCMLAADRLGLSPCEKDDRSRPISLSTLAHRIPSSLRIQRGLDRRSLVSDDHKSKAPSQQELLAEYVAILAGYDNVSSSVQGKRFLAPFGTNTILSAGGSGRVATSFTIEYGNIIHELQVQLVRSVVVERFGPMAGRIFSILVEKGKLEEKHIAKLGLLSMNDTRDICSRLFAASLLNLQEVPKSNERNPQRTFFLWFVDLDKCKAWLLDHQYKTLAQLSRRRFYEQRRKTSLLRKADRTDVREDSDALLTDWERKSLAALHSVQEAISVAEERVALDVFVMEQFST